MHALEIIAFCLDGHRAPTLVDDVRWPEAQHQKLVTGQLRCVLGRLLRFFVLGGRPQRPFLLRIAPPNQEERVVFRSSEQVRLS